MGDKNVKFKHMASYDIEYEENFIKQYNFHFTKIFIKHNFIFPQNFPN